MIFLLVTILTGCQANLHSSMDDYKGNDTAKIRVLDKGVLSATLYDKQGACYKEIGTKRLTSFFMLSLFGQADTAVASSKKVNMIHPSNFGNSSVNEYIIKGEQTLGITSRTQEVSYSGETKGYSNTIYFTPLTGHEYEISVVESKYASNPSSPSIVDLTSDKKEVPYIHKITMCD